MDQTAIFCMLGSKTTVEVIGRETVPAVCGGNDSWRCAVALTVNADGQMQAPHFVFKAELGGEMEKEVRAYALEEVATFSVQRNAWFDVRVMLEWIEHCCLAVYKCDTVIEALARYGAAVKFVPLGCAGAAQPLDAGVMGPFKTHIRTSYAEYYSSHAFPSTAAQRRKDMYTRAIGAISSITHSTARNSFHKSGPFVPFGPPNDALVNLVADVAEEETIVCEF